MFLAAFHVSWLQIWWDAPLSIGSPMADISNSSPNYYCRYGLTGDWSDLKRTQYRFY